MADVLTDEDISAHWLLLHPAEIVTIERVEAYLNQHGLEHRNAVTITAAIDWIRPESKPVNRQPITSPEQVAFEQNQMNGYGDAPAVQQQLASFVAGIE